MKHLITLALMTVLATPAFATKNNNVTAATMAELLISRKAAPCVAEIQALPYDLEVYESTAKRTPTAKGFITEVQFGAIEGGDIMVGTITLKIVEKYGQQFGFPESKVLYVDSCSVTKDLVD